MKFMKKAKIYKGSNVTFNPETCQAHSYGWWCFVRKLESGIVIFNNYSYSPTTQRHQSKVWWLMDELGVKPDVTLRFTNISMRCDQDAVLALRTDKLKALDAIDDIQASINAPRTHKSTNERRADQIKDLRDHISEITKILQKEY